jgi:hypothetical protein
MATKKKNTKGAKDTTMVVQLERREICEKKLDSFEADVKAGRLGIRSALALACMAGVEFQATAPSGARAR